MAVLIKGMEMPESCWVCKLCFCGYKCEATGESTMTLPIDAKLDTCPIIEIPDAYIDISKAFMTELCNKVCTDIPVAPLHLPHEEGKDAD